MIPDNENTVLLDRRVKEKWHNHFYFCFIYWKYILVNKDPAGCSGSQGNMAFLQQITGVSTFKPITLTLPIKTKTLFTGEHETGERLKKLHPDGNISHEKWQWTMC